MVLVVGILAIFAGGAYRGLQKTYGPNVRDGIRRRKLVAAECELIRLTEASGQTISPRTIWWEPATLWPKPTLENYDQLMRCINYETFIARAQLTPLQNSLVAEQSPTQGP